jgi:hypothetical protein
VADDVLVAEETSIAGDAVAPVTEAVGSRQAVAVAGRPPAESSPSHEHAAGPAATPRHAAWGDAVLVALVALGTILRVVGLGRVALTPDETFSAYTSHLPLGQISGAVRASDPHPPLSYWLLHPVTELTTSTAGLRLSMALCSVAALVLMAVWQRHRGVAGLVATAAFAVTPFDLIFGRELRMYPLVQLFGVALAWATYRWVSGDRRARWVVVASVAGLALALSHGSGVILLGALLLVPGLQRDRSAWIWRMAVGAALFAFLVYWGPAMVGRSSWGSTYPHLSASWVPIALNEWVAPVPSNRFLVIGLLAAGMAVAIATDRILRRVLLVCCLVPLAIALVLSVHTNVFGAKTFVMLAWAPPLAFGALVAWAGRSRPLAGGAVFAVLVLLIVPYVQPAIDYDEHLGPMMAAVSASRADGDVVAIRDAPGGHIFQWYLGVVDDLPEHKLSLPIPDSAAFLYGNRPWDGRVWLVETDLHTHPAVVAEATSCAPRRAVGPSYHLRCLEFPPAVRDRILHSGHS